MKKNLIIVAITAMLFGCSIFVPNRNPASIEDIDPSDIQHQKEKKQKFIILAEETLSWRAKAIDFHKHLKETDVLSNEDLVTLHRKGSDQYFKLRTELLRYINDIKWVAERNVEIHANSNETSIHDSLINTDENANLDGPDITQKIKILKIDKHSDSGKYIINDITIGLAAAILLSDNYLLAISPYQNDKKFRRIINEDNTDYKNVLRKITESFYDQKNNELLVRSRAIYDHIYKSKAVVKARPYLTPVRINGADHDLYLRELIESSETYKNIKNFGYEYLRKEHAGTMLASIKDQLRKLLSKTLFEISKDFGNGVGSVQERDGKLYNMDPAQEKTISDQLKPLDILLEKTPFRLTDKLIPGHWGHVAVWVGTEVELKNLGVWDELPSIYEHAKKNYEYDGEDFQQAIRSGHRIVEALRPGVQINTLAHFLNIDDLGVIRRKTLTDQQKREFLIRTFEQIGKEYDFNFDVESDKRIVCSELAYVTFPDIDWSTKKTLGRETISPDNIADLAKNLDSPFAPILLYHDGKLLKNSLLENFNNLLELSYNKIKF